MEFPSGQSWLLTFLLLASPATSGAEPSTCGGEETDPTPAAAPASTRLLLSIEVSGARGVTSLFGGVTDRGRGMLSLALRTHRPLVDRAGLRLDYTGGLVPLELAHGTRVRESSLAALSSSPATVYGAGLDALGLTAYLGESPRWRPFVAARGGFRVFSSPVPDPRGTRFNFSADGGGGLAFRAAPGRFLTLSVELHHLSNGGLGSANPSLNQFTLGVGVEGSRRSPVSVRQEKGGR